jgi:hypothetical protein
VFAFRKTRGKVRERKGGLGESEHTIRHSGPSPPRGESSLCPAGRTSQQISKTLAIHGKSPTTCSVMGLLVFCLRSLSDLDFPSPTGS